MVIQKKKRLCFEFQHLRMQTYWFTLCKEEQKRLARDVFDIVATFSGLIDCVTVSCFLEFETSIF